MIYTRFGTPVQVVCGDIEKGEIDIFIDYRDGKKHKIFKTYVWELKADEGIKEISEAIQKANEGKNGKS